MTATVGSSATDGPLRRSRQSCENMDYVSYAGDLTPEQAWELLRENPDAVLVDVRTDAEWKYVGVPDVSSLGRPH